MEDNGLRGCPAWTQYFRETETIHTSSQWAKLNIGVLVEGQFKGKNVFKITETTAIGSHSLDHAAVGGFADMSIMGMTFYAKPNGRNVLTVNIVDKANTSLGVAKLDLSNGTIPYMRDGYFVAGHIDPDADGWLLCHVAFRIGSGSYAPQVKLLLTESLLDGAWYYTGDGVSGAYLSHASWCNFGVNGTPWIPPYVPNTTTSALSVVSEAGSTTNGTSFDLDPIVTGKQIGRAHV